MDMVSEKPQTKSPSPFPLPPVRQTAKDYRNLGLGYLDDLPSIAGISDVRRAGFPVETCAGFLARFAAIKKKCALIAAGRMSGAPEWEFKMALARWLWEDATHYRDLEERLLELRSNRAVVDKVLDYQLGDFLNEILHAPGSLALCVGLFDVLDSAFFQALRDYLVETQPLVDFPTVRLLKRLLAEEEERLELGRRFLEVFARQEEGAQTRADWKEHLRHFLDWAGGILGRDPLPEGNSRPVSRAQEMHDAVHEFSRDERFTVYVPKMPPEEVKNDLLLTTMWTRCHEMPIAETMAVIIYEWEDLPTQALVDLARHCWDEMRHTAFGDVALEAAGLERCKFNHSWVGFGVHAFAESPQKPTRTSRSPSKQASWAIPEVKGESGSFVVTRRSTLS